MVVAPAPALLPEAVVVPAVPGAAAVIGAVRPLIPLSFALSSAIFGVSVTVAFRPFILATDSFSLTISDFSITLATKPLILYTLSLSLAIAFAFRIRSTTALIPVSFDMDFWNPALSGTSVTLLLDLGAFLALATCVAVPVTAVSSVDLRLWTESFIWPIDFLKLFAAVPPLTRTLIFASLWSSSNFVLSDASLPTASESSTITEYLMVFGLPLLSSMIFLKDLTIFLVALTFSFISLADIMIGAVAIVLTAATPAPLSLLPYFARKSSSAFFAAPRLAVLFLIASWI